MTCKAPLIGELKARRENLGWSTKEVSDRCGIDEKFLGDWEHGIGAPRLDVFIAWAGALGVKLALLPAESAGGRGVKVDWNRRHITVDGTAVRLTPMEWKALERLSWSPGELVTHRDLFRHLYGDTRHYRAQSTAVRVLITKLRRLLPVRIEARWGKGYVIGGVEPSLGQASSIDDSIGRRCADNAPPAGAPVRELSPFMPKAAPRGLPPSLRRELVTVADHGLLRFAPPAAARPNPCRAEELSVIERFLTERGVTRCPDGATIQQSPLPTLVWDKIKRKWVRPAMVG